MLHNVAVIGKAYALVRIGSLASALAALRLHAAEMRASDQSTQAHRQAEALTERWAAATLEGHFSGRLRLCFFRWRLWTANKSHTTDRSECCKCHCVKLRDYHAVPPTSEGLISNVGEVAVLLI